MLFIFTLSVFSCKIMLIMGIYGFSSRNGCVVMAKDQDKRLSSVNEEEFEIFGAHKTREQIKAEEKARKQAEREAMAAERIFGILPPDQKEELYSLFREFEECSTPESKFAHAMDNFQPLLLNDSNDGADWIEHKVKRSQVTERQKKSALGAREIWEYSLGLIEKNVERGNIIDDAEK